MKKKKSPRKIIESAKNPERESMYAKYPGGEITDIAKRRGKYSTSMSYNKLKKIKDKRGESHTHIHTHPSSFNLRKISPENRGSAKMMFENDLYTFPTYSDINSFLQNKDQKTMVIVGRDPKTGKVGRSVFFRKTRNTSKDIGILPSGIAETIYELQYGKDYRGKGYPLAMGTLKQIANEYGFQVRELDEKGKTVWKYNPLTKNAVSLESKAIASAFLFLSSLFLISFKFTGFSIYRISANSLSLLGATLFLISLIFMFLSFRKKKSS
jgi:hypothetical protein|tara:strand:+ start:6546 stop:7349 length:804 start_codon:yes stop_codon:yes gene_type:complete